MPTTFGTRGDTGLDTRTNKGSKVGWIVFAVVMLVLGALLFMNGNNRPQSTSYGGGNLDVPQTTPAAGVNSGWTGNSMDGTKDGTGGISGGTGMASDRGTSSGVGETGSGLTTPGQGRGMFNPSAGTGSQSSVGSRSGIGDRSNASTGNSYPAGSASRGIDPSAGGSTGTGMGLGAGGSQTGR